MYPRPTLLQRQIDRFVNRTPPAPAQAFNGRTLPVRWPFWDRVLSFQRSAATMRATDRAV